MTPHDIEMIISKITGVPTSRIGEDDITALQNLEGELKARVIGQDRAVEHVALAIKRSRAGLNADNRLV